MKDSKAPDSEETTHAEGTRKGGDGDKIRSDGRMNKMET
jgi:hypothetical protein